MLLDFISNLSQSLVNSDSAVCVSLLLYWLMWNDVSLFGTKYSRMDQVKFVEDSLSKI